MMVNKCILFLTMLFALVPSMKADLGSLLNRYKFTLATPMLLLGTIKLFKQESAAEAQQLKLLENGYPQFKEVYARMQQERLKRYHESNGSQTFPRMDKFL